MLWARQRGSAARPTSRGSSGGRTPRRTAPHAAGDESRFRPRHGARLLHNAQAQERAINSLAEIAERDQYVGWQLDFEGIDPADKLAYTRFVARVAARLHRDHRLLSVAVVPRFSDVFPDNSTARFSHRRVGRGVRLSAASGAWPISWCSWPTISTPP